MARKKKSAPEGWGPEQDAEMIRDTGRWPLPFLPVKRSGEGMPKLGVVLNETPREPLRVYKLDWNTGVATEVLETYKTVNEMVDDGWRVD